MLLTEEQIRRRYDTAVALRKSRKNEITFDVIDDDAEQVIRILGEVLCLKES